MAFSIYRESERGEVLESIGNRYDTVPLKRLLPQFDETSFPCLRFIDPDGDTTFNVFQIEHQFLPEWTRLYERAQSEEDKQLLRAIEDMAHRCLEEVHVYLKFVGD